MAKPKLLEDKIIGHIRTNVVEWEDANVFVTDKVAFRMRELIKQLRKNYWGIFDEPINPITGERKVWIPLTESTVEAVVKNIDLDTKDINLRAKRPQAVPLTSLMRNALKNSLDAMYFGEYLDQLERNLAVDGTAVWKTIEVMDESLGRKAMKIMPVDLLNFYIDPSAPSIEEASMVVERAVLTPYEFSLFDGWMNTNLVKPQENIHRTDVNMSMQRGTGKMIEVWEAWGDMPEWMLTGEEKDEDLMPMHVVIANMHTDPVLLLVEKNEKNIKPYEEAWLRRMPGRWYGKGIAEMLMLMQLWVNIVDNTRIDRNRTAGLGILKVRKGSGITPSMVSKMVANGAISVSSMDDIEQLVINEASQASYNDEAVIQNWSERVTQAFDVVTGEALPASTPATNAVIQNQNAQSSFTLIKEGVGMFLQRWLKRHGLPIIAKTLKKKDIVRMTGDVQELEKLDNNIANGLLKKKITEVMEAGGILDEQQVAQEKQRIMDELAKQGEDRFIKLLQDPDFTYYDVQVYVTNEEIDKGVLVQNLLGSLQLAPEYRDVILPQIFDVMGIDSTLLKAATPQPTEGQPTQGGVGVPQVAQGNGNAQSQFLAANSSQ